MHETLSLQSLVRDASRVRYIKLGVQGQQTAACIQAGELGLSFREIDHGLCEAGRWEDIAKVLRASDKSKSDVSETLRELRAFYEDDGSCLWITFFDNHIYWGFADGGVLYDPALKDRLPRRRRLVGSGWSKLDLAGGSLNTQRLRRRLTNVRAYRRTICDVKDHAYLKNVLQGIGDPLLAEAAILREQLHDMARRLIEQLHEKEFEILVDLIFHASGWRRVSVLGEIQKDADLFVEQIATGERAFVQVKSRATPSLLDDYVRRWRDYPDSSRMVFACHSPTAALLQRKTTPANNLDLWFGRDLAEKAVNAGLYGWLIERIR